jgi:hypothetical protein
VQPVEIGDAINAEQDRLAIDHKGRLPIAQGCLNDQRISAGPVVAVAGEQPDAGGARSGQRFGRRALCELLVDERIVGFDP